MFVAFITRKKKEIQSKMPQLRILLCEDAKEFQRNQVKHILYIENIICTIREHNYTYK